MLMCFRIRKIVTFVPKITIIINIHYNSGLPQLNPVHSRTSAGVLGQFIHVLSLVPGPQRLLHAENSVHDVHSQSEIILNTKMPIQKMLRRKNNNYYFIETEGIIQ